MRVVFVHGACVRDGEWWWHRSAELLRSRGVSSATPALPGCGEGPAVPGGRIPSLAEDVASVRRELAEADEPTIVVAHSYGAIVTSEAAAGIGTVRHLLLVSSYLPEPGESLSTFGGDSPAPFLDVDVEGGTFSVRPDMLVESFLQDCPPAVQDAADRHLARQSLSVTQQPVRTCAWKDIPSTYLVCAEDRGTPAASQRTFARRAGNVVEISAGHHPFLSQPERFADLVMSLG